MTSSPEHAQRLAVIDAANERLTITSGPPEAADWFCLDQLRDDACLDRLLAGIEPHTHGIATAEAAAISGWLGYSLSWLLLGATAFAGHTIRPLPQQVWVALHPDQAWPSRVSVAPSAHWDPPPALMREVDITAVVDSLMTLLTPLVDRLSARRMLGAHALWSQVTDSLAQQSRAVCLAAGGSEDEGFDLAGRLLEAFPMTLLPPQWLAMWRGDTEQTLLLRQSCCMAYKVDGHGWCPNCPLLDDVSRAKEIEDWLSGAGH